MASVTLKNINKIYDKNVHAVKNVNLEIHDRDFVVLVGPSGCGKSTLLRMISGLEHITDGELLIEERLMNDVEPGDRDIAMVFQNYALFPHMTAYQNMAFGLINRKVPKEEIDTKIMEVAKILDIESLIHRKPKAMSGGQRQRIALGRAMVKEPKVFLLDEPLSNLDAKLRTSMRAQIVKLHQKLQATFIYVTHDQIEAMTMGNKIVVMKDGIIQQVGSPKEIYHNPTNKFVAGFIGTPQMNFIAGTVQKKNENILFFTDENVKFPFDLDDFTILKNNFFNKSLILGVRPEHIELSATGTFKGYVEYIEHLGSESNIYIRFGKTELIAKTFCEADIAQGDCIAFDISKDNIYLFDEKTGERLENIQK